jgi:hypothetical protein
MVAAEVSELPAVQEYRGGGGEARECLAALHFDATTPLRLPAARAFRHAEVAEHREACHAADRSRLDSKQGRGGRGGRPARPRTLGAGAGFAEDREHQHEDE